MEWFYKLLYSLVDHYVHEKDREAAKSFVDIILEHALEVCASNIPVETRGVCALYGVDLGVADVRGNKESLWRMKLELSDLANDYFLALMNPKSTRLHEIILEAEACISDTMQQLKWPEQTLSKEEDDSEGNEKPSPSICEDIFIYEGSPIQEEGVTQEESATQEERSARNKSPDQDNPLRLKIPPKDALRQEVTRMFSQIIRHIDEGKGLLSLETCFGVLSKLLDILEGPYALPNNDYAFVLQAVIQMAEIPDKNTRSFFQKIGSVNARWTTDVCQKFALHLDRALYHLVIKDKDNPSDLAAAADRLYLILWELLGSQITQESIRNLLTRAGNTLIKYLNEDVPPLFEVNDLALFPTDFFKTPSGQGFYINLHKEVYDLFINEATEEELIAASDRLYLLLWEVDSPLTPQKVVSLVRASLEKQRINPPLSLFDAVSSVPFPDHFFKTQMGYLFLEILQDALLQLLEQGQREASMQVATDNLYSSLPPLLTGVTSAAVTQLLKERLSQLKFKLAVEKGAPLYTLDLLKYAARANRLLGGTLHDPLLHQAFITHFKSDSKYSLRQWDAGVFAQLVLGLMVLYLKQDESFFVLSTGDFWKDSFIFFKNSTQRDITVKNMLMIEREVFALIDHNATISHERLRQFVNEEPAETVDMLLEDCRKQGGDDFYTEMRTYYQSFKSPCRHQTSSCLFFPSFEWVQSKNHDQSNKMEVQEEPEASGCWLQ